MNRRRVGSARAVTSVHPELAGTTCGEQIELAFGALIAISVLSPFTLGWGAVRTINRHARA